MVRARLYPLPVLTRGLAVSFAALMLGACAQTADLVNTETSLLSPKAEDEADKLASPTGPQSELQKATLYWGKEFNKNPTDKKAAISYAKNLKALGEKRQALGVMQQTSALFPKDPDVLSEYGRLALDFDQVSLAGKLLEAADDPAKPDWHVVSARGTVLAKQSRYKEAIEFFDRALALQPNQPSIMSNLAMAHAMSGDAKTAEGILRDAAAQPEATPAIKQNLALVLGLQGRHEEAKVVAANIPGGSASANADYLRQLVKAMPQGAAVAVASAPASGTIGRVADATAIAAFKTEVTPAKAPVVKTAAAVANAAGGGASGSNSSGLQLKSTVTALRPAAEAASTIWSTEVAANQGAAPVPGEASVAGVFKSTRQ